MFTDVEDAPPGIGPTPLRKMKAWDEMGRHPAHIDVS